MVVTSYVNTYSYLDFPFLIEFDFRNAFHIPVRTHKHMILPFTIKQMFFCIFFTINIHSDFLCENYHVYNSFVLHDSQKKKIFNKRSPRIVECFEFRQGESTVSGSNEGARNSLYVQKLSVTVIFSL